MASIDGQHRARGRACGRRNLQHPSKPTFLDATPSRQNKRADPSGNASTTHGDDDADENRAGLSLTSANDQHPHADRRAAEDGPDAEREDEREQDALAPEPLDEAADQGEHRCGRDGVGATCPDEVRPMEPFYDCRKRGRDGGLRCGGKPVDD